MLKMKVNRQLKKLKLNLVVNLVKQIKLHQKKILIKKLKMKLVKIKEKKTDNCIFISIILATGDDNTENEGQSPTKKAKGKPGRKPGQTNKTTKNKDTDQEIENDTGKHQR
jgi:hypothetical protein